MSDPATLLHQAGLKATPARKRVLTLLAAARQPLSHAEIEARCVSADAAALDRVTLYRVLEALVGSGLALKAVDARGVSRFTASAVQQQHASHVHFRCIGCGGVFCLAAAPPQPPELPRGFQLAAVELDVRGTCAACNGDNPPEGLPA